MRPGGAVLLCAVIAACPAQGQAWKAPPVETTAQWLSACESNDVEVYTACVYYMRGAVDTARAARWATAKSRDHNAPDEGNDFFCAPKETPMKDLIAAVQAQAAADPDMKAIPPSMTIVLALSKTFPCPAGQ